MERTEEDEKVGYLECPKCKINYAICYCGTFEEVN